MPGEAEAKARTLLRLLIASAALLALLATAVAIPLSPGEDSDEMAGRVLVGDLKLADEDEGPSNGVRATFQATNLAPGDRTMDRLRLLADEPQAEGHSFPTQAAVDRTLWLAFHVEQGPPTGPIARALVVEELSYGGQDLARGISEACQGPVTMATLLACPEAEGPLSGLEAPSPSGTDLVLGLQMAPGTGNEVQGTSLGFAVEATLEAGQRSAPAQGAVVLCVDLGGDDALFPYVEKVDVPVACEVVF